MIGLGKDDPDLVIQAMNDIELSNFPSPLLIEKYKETIN